MKQSIGSYLWQLANYIVTPVLTIIWVIGKDKYYNKCYHNKKYYSIYKYVELKSGQSIDIAWIQILAFS